MDEALEKFKQEVQSAEMNINDRTASTYHIVREMARYLIAKEEQATLKEDVPILKKAIGDVIKDKSPYPTEIMLCHDCSLLFKKYMDAFWKK